MVRRAPSPLKLSGHGGTGRNAVEGFGDLIGDLVHGTCQFLTDHHLHHHWQLDIEYQAHAGIRIADAHQLQPEGEIHGGALCTGHLDQFGLNLFDHLQVDLKSLHLERAGVGCCAPPFDFVAEYRRQMAEIGEHAVNHRGRLQDLNMFAFVSFHEVDVLIGVCRLDRFLRFSVH